VFKYEQFLERNIASFLYFVYFASHQQTLYVFQCQRCRKTISIRTIVTKQRITHFLLQV